MQPEEVKQLRAQLATAVRGGEAHLDAASVFNEVGEDEWGAKTERTPHTLWQLLEHMRFTLQDLYIFSTDPDYKAPDWPKDYWPATETPDSPEAAEHSLLALHSAIASMSALVESEEIDLFQPIPWGSGQTILREALLAATHTSYHLGQAMFLRKQLEK